MNKEKIIKAIIHILIAIILLAIGLLSTSQVNATVKGITSKNYDSYVKPISDEYGYNKGECEKEYLAGEEYFYNEYYDHWNVDKVYDSSLIPKDKAKDKAKEKKMNKKNKKKAKRT